MASWTRIPRGQPTQRLRANSHWRHRRGDITRTAVAAERPRSVASETNKSAGRSPAQSEDRLSTATLVSSRAGRGKLTRGLRVWYRRRRLCLVRWYRMPFASASSRCDGTSRRRAVCYLTPVANSDGDDRVPHLLVPGPRPRSRHALDLTCHPQRDSPVEQGSARWHP